MSFERRHPDHSQGQQTRLVLKLLANDNSRLPGLQFEAALIQQQPICPRALGQLDMLKADAPQQATEVGAARCWPDLGDDALVCALGLVDEQRLFELLMPDNVGKAMLTGG